MGRETRPGITWQVAPLGRRARSETGGEKKEATIAENPPLSPRYDRLTYRRFTRAL